MTGEEHIYVFGCLMRSSSYASSYAATGIEARENREESSLQAAGVHWSRGFKAGRSRCAMVKRFQGLQGAGVQWSRGLRAGGAGLGPVCAH
eukprot:1145080-Pelagomonas_calceolata.AAC.3